MSDNKMEKDYYNKGTIKPIDFVEEQELNFNRGNVVKYIIRAGRKTPDLESHLEDLNKCKYYLEREISKIAKLKDQEYSRMATPEEMAQLRAQLLGA